MRLVIVGDATGTVYEWLLVRAGRLVDHSNDAWLDAAAARRAGLSAANDVAPNDAEALRLAKQIIARAKARAAAPLPARDAGGLGS